jgi:hypothetical protein
MSGKSVRTTASKTPQSEFAESPSSCSPRVLYDGRGEVSRAVREEEKDVEGKGASRRGRKGEERGNRWEENALPDPTPRPIAPNYKSRPHLLLSPGLLKRPTRSRPIHRINLIIRQDVRAMQPVRNGSDLSRGGLFFAEVAEGEGDGVGRGGEVGGEGVVDAEGGGSDGAVDNEVVWRRRNSAE